MREIVVQPKDRTEDLPPLIEVRMEGKVLQARRPKESTLARAAGIFADKYASNSLLAKTSFDFLEAALEPDSWVWVLGRLQDREDDFNTDHVTALFEGLFEEFKAHEPAEPANRAARRAAPKTRTRA